MIRITQQKLPIAHTEEQLHRKIAKMLRLGNQPFTYEIRKQSLDARHKEDKKFVYTVDIKLDNESRVLKKVHDKNIMLTSEKKYHFPSSGSETLSHRPIVIGSGPAGLFCAWITMNMVGRQPKSSEKCSPQRTMRCLNNFLHRERIGMSICCNEMCSGKGGDNFQKKK